MELDLGPCLVLPAERRFGLVLNPRLAGVVHDREVLARSRKGEDPTPDRRRANHHDVEIPSTCPLVGEQDRRQRGLVHEGHAAEIEDDQLERLLPKGREGGVDVPNGGAVEVACNAEIDEPVPLMSSQSERVRFARDTSSFLLPLRPGLVEG